MGLAAIHASVMGAWYSLLMLPYCFIAIATCMVIVFFIIPSYIDPCRSSVALDPRLPATMSVDQSVRHTSQLSRYTYRHT